MKLLKELMSPKKPLECLLLLLIVVYILCDLKTPTPLVTLINSLFGRVLLVVVAIFCLCHLNPIIAVLMIYALYELHNRTKDAYGMRLVPTDQCRFENIETQNSFEDTLEQEVINNSSPPTYGVADTSINYEPNMSYDGNASPI